MHITKRFSSRPVLFFFTFTIFFLHSVTAFALTPKQHSSRGRVAQPQATQLSAVAWVEVSPDNEPFTAIIPSSPSRTEQQVQHGKGNVTVRSYRAKSSNDTAFAVYVLDNLESVGAPSYKTFADEAFLDSGIDLIWNSLLKEARTKARKSQSIYSIQENVL